MVYPHDSTLDNIDIANTDENLNKASEANYKKNTKIYGDAIKEISTTGANSTSWNNDYSRFAGLSHPFIVHGGNFWYVFSTGSFCFTRNTGLSDFSISFRPVVIPIA